MEGVVTRGHIFYISVKVIIFYLITVCIATSKGDIIAEILAVLLVKHMKSYCTLYSYFTVFSLFFSCVIS